MAWEDQHKSTNELLAEIRDAIKDQTSDILGALEAIGQDVHAMMNTVDKIEESR